MIESYRCLNERMATVRALERLKKEADPASGITISVRRGAMSDDTPRDSILLEVGVGFEAVLDMLIADQRESAEFFSRIVAGDMAEAAKAVEAYRTFASI